MPNSGMEQAMNLVKQSFYCEICKRGGVIHFEEHDDVWTVVNSIKAEHTTISPECEFSVFKVRIRALDGSDEEWNNVTKDKVN